MSEQFPDVRWGSEHTPLRRQAMAFGATRAGSWLIRTLAPLDRRLIARSKGRFTVLGPFGMPTLLITTTGARSGQPRTNPLLYLRDGDRLLVIGSNFGQAHHPAWSGNLLKDPHATVTMAGREIPVVARRLEGDERDAAIARFVAFSRTYAVYQQRTDRDLRVFALVPAQP